MDMGIDPMDPGMMDPTVTETAPGTVVWAGCSSWAASQLWSLWSWLL